MTDIQKPTTANAADIIGDNWIQDSENAFLSLSVKEEDSADTASHVSQSTVKAASIALAALGVEDPYRESRERLNCRAAEHRIKASIAKAHSETIIDSKRKIADVVAAFEELAKQSSSTETLDNAKVEARNNVASIFRKYKIAEREALMQFSGGTRPSTHEYATV